MPNDVVTLRNTPISLASDVGRAFVSDVARLLEKLIDLSQLRERYGLSNEDWKRCAETKTLQLAVQTELKHRIRSGVSAQELAVKEFATTPSSVPSLPTLIKDHSFVEDLARFADGTYTEQAIRKKYRLEESDWDALGKDDTLVRAIEDRKLHRIRNGATKRERAQIEIVNGPPALAKIMKDPNANQRHVIDAIKCLNDLATPEPTTAQNSSERFIITINLGNDEKLTFNKKIAPDPNDIDPNDIKTIDHAPQELLAIAAANKQNGGNSGEPL
jgi:hypothetical protein